MMNLCRVYVALSSVMCSMASSNAGLRDCEIARLRGHAPGLGIVESVPNKDLLPLAQQIMRLRIGIGQLLAFHSAVYEKADIERIPLDKAAYKVVEDIRDYSQLGGLKKEQDRVQQQI